MKIFSQPTRSIIILFLLMLVTGCAKSPEPSETILYHEKEGIWSMTPEGKDKQQLSSFGWFAEYSPDNSKIAFGKIYEGGIWVANADGSDPVQLTTFGSAPSWSPDGSRLVFHSAGPSGDPIKGADRHIWIMEVDGSDVHQLSKTSGSFPDWSPDGEMILFHGEVNNGIWQIAPDGSEERMLYRDGGYPAWSPNGEEIAFINLYDWCVWVMNADGTNKRKLTDNYGFHPSWSADGLKIAYESMEEKSKSVWIINSDGSGDHKISDNARFPDWSNSVK